MTGVVTAIVRDRKEGERMVKRGGYGFIRDEENQERFFHAHNLRGISFENLREGTAVTFLPVNVGEKGNGLRAEEVKVAV
jgi:cold shock CspA family protein